MAAMHAANALGMLVRERDAARQAAALGAVGLLAQLLAHRDPMARMEAITALATVLTAGGVSGSAAAPAAVAIPAVIDMLRQGRAVPAAEAGAAGVLAAASTVSYMARVRHPLPPLSMVIVICRVAAGGQPLPHPLCSDGKNLL